MAAVTVLMVAEKPALATAIALALCPGGPTSVTKRKGASPSSPVHEYDGIFRGHPARFKVTATTGHIYSLDFTKESNDWQKTAPADLFHARTVHCYDPSTRIPDLISSEAVEADALVLWLDCDREGENICFEVMQLAVPHMSTRMAWQGAYEDRVFRAHFSSLSPVDLLRAMDNLGHPDICQAHSVDARQEIDLRLGCAFTRLQTQYFRAHFGKQLGKLTVSYGPCQFPTLWFCVKRHCEIEAFVPVPFWRLAVSVSINGTPTRCDLQSGEIWDSETAQSLAADLRSGSQTATVKSVRSWHSHATRPKPLNTVAMLKMASNELGIGPGDAMALAERLYLKGILSYPRTETCRYPENFDLRGTTRTLAGPGAPWAQYASALLEGGSVEPRRDGDDMGDHPPITPVKLATRSQCEGEAGWVLYCAICRHFLATISPDADFVEAEMQLDVQGQLFSTTSSRCLTAGWGDVAERDFSDEGPVDLAAFGRADTSGMSLPVVGVEVTGHQTRPPGHLTESELLALMDDHGIGTDASMAQHVSKVQQRKYVTLDERTRQMVPSPLGLALAHGYALVDIGLLLPSVRARIENACGNVAKGLVSKSVVIARTLRIFERKLVGLAGRIDRIPLMLAVAYSQSSDRQGPVAGGAADEARHLWSQAEAQHRGVTLEGLLEAKDRDELDQAEEDGDEVPSIPASAITQRSEAVLRVQQALEELGFGPPESYDAPQDRPQQPPQQTQQHQPQQQPPADDEQPGGGGGRNRRRRGGKSGGGNRDSAGEVRSDLTRGGPPPQQQQSQSQDRQRPPRQEPMGQGPPRSDGWMLQRQQQWQLQQQHAQQRAPPQYQQWQMQEHQRHQQQQLQNYDQQEQQRQQQQNYHQQIDNHHQWQMHPSQPVNAQPYPMQSWWDAGGGR